MILQARPRRARAKRTDGGATGDREYNAARSGRVYVLRNGQPAPVRVRIVATDGSNTAVESSELRDGAEVITDEVSESAGAATASAGAAGAGGAQRSGSGGGGSRGPRMF